MYGGLRANRVDCFLIGKGITLGGKTAPQSADYEAASSNTANTSGATHASARLDHRVPNVML